MYIRNSNVTFLSETSDIEFKIHDQLHPTLWNRDGTLKSGVKTQLMKIADTFNEFMCQPKIKLVDVVIVGSMANYNYTKESDIDLHLIYDLSDMEGKIDVADFLATKRVLWLEKHEIFYKGIPVEVSPQGKDGKVGKLQSRGCYSLMSNKWISDPEKYTKDQLAQINDDRVVKDGQKLIKQIQPLISNPKINAKHVERLTGMLKQLKDLRAKGLKQEDGEISHENLVYKYVRAKGWVMKLLTHIDSITDAVLSK